MTDRRPHWDDDLVEAVADAVDYTLLAGQMYDVIAAVEDWLGPVEEMVNDGERVKRVRELHVEGPHQTCMVCATWKTWADGRTDLLGEPWPCSTIRILDGDSDE